VYHTRRVFINKLIVNVSLGSLSINFIECYIRIVIIINSIATPAHPDSLEGTSKLSGESQDVPPPPTIKFLSEK